MRHDRIYCLLFLSVTIYDFFLFFGVPNEEYILLGKAIVLGLQNMVEVSPRRYRNLQERA